MVQQPQKILATVQQMRRGAPFPVDLLRQQQCLPLTADDSRAIVESIAFAADTGRAIYSVRLVATKKPTMTFNPVAWADSGWQVVDAKDVGDPLATFCLLMDATRSGVNLVWWKPRRHGYTSDFDEAGLYGPLEARQLAMQSGGDTVAVPVPLARKLAVTVVPEAQRLALLGELKEAARDAANTPHPETNP